MHGFPFHDQAVPYRPHNVLFMELKTVRFLERQPWFNALSKRMKGFAQRLAARQGTPPGGIIFPNCRGWPFQEWPNCSFRYTSSNTCRHSICPSRLHPMKSPWRGKVVRPKACFTADRTTAYMARSSSNFISVLVGCTFTSICFGSISIKAHKRIAPFRYQAFKRSGHRMVEVIAFNKAVVDKKELFPLFSWQTPAFLCNRLPLSSRFLRYEANCCW